MMLTPGCMVERKSEPLKEGPAARRGVGSTRLKSCEASLMDIRLLRRTTVETVCCLYHQKKDFVSVPYEPKDVEYLKE